MAETTTTSGIRIVHPDELSVSSMAETPAGLARGSSFTRAASGDDWVGPLKSAGFEIVDNLAFQPPAAGLRRAPGAEAEEPTTIDVPVPPDTGAVILIQSDGLYHWALPSEDVEVAAALRTPGRAGAAKRFILGAAVPGGGAQRGAAPVTRGPIFDWIVGTKAFQAIVLRFALGPMAGALAGWIDGDGPFGLCSLEADDADLWRPKLGGPLAMRAGANRVLLFVHGTFSSTRGSFGDLLAQPRGRNFLAEAKRKYGLVMGFDHKTLSASTTQNAKDLADALARLRLPPDTVIDAVAYSRGGLVLRGLIEQELQTLANDLRVKVRKMIFVGCTNAGTHLAEPDNWGALTDLYTTLCLSAASATAVVPGVGAVTRFAATAVPAVGRFVQLMAMAGVQGKFVPGLAAMEPGGDIVKALNSGDGRPTKPGYYVVSAKFDPGAHGDAKFNPALIALYQIAHDLFQVDNDLVVDTAAMNAFSPGVELDAAEEFGRTPDVYHICYFINEMVAERLAQWLEAEALRPTVRSGPPRQSVAPRTDLDGLPGVTRGGPLAEAPDLGMDEETFEHLRGARLSPPEEPMEAGEPAAGAAAETPAPSALGRGFDIGGTVASFDIAATMPPEVPIKTSVELTVVISRGHIVVQAGDTTAKMRVELIAAKPLTLRVLAVENCALVENGADVGGANRTILLPQLGVNRVEKFFVRGGDAPGPARIVISALQGGKEIAEIELTPKIVTELGAALSATATAFVGASPNRSALVLRIFESRVGDAYRLRFIADCPDVDVNIDCFCDIKVDPAEYSRQRFAEIEKIVAAGSSFKNATDRLRDHGANMGDFMIPKEVRETVWSNRAQLAAIQVISDETPLPWELACLRGPGNGDPVFLAEFGLVRWIKNAGWPATQLRLRGENFYLLAPTYTKTGWALPGAQEEIADIKKFFRTTHDLEASFSAVRSFLAGANSVDGLHVACHGAASGDAAQVAGLYLSDSPDDILGNSSVRQALRVGEDSNPIVFLNACQVGRPGAGISDIDGFAQAFLAPRSGTGAAVVVAPLWSVGDLRARTFANVFYEQMLKGVTLVEAVREARARAKAQSELTWLSYSVYGHPFARVVSATS